MSTDKPKPHREWTLTGEYIYYKDYGGQEFSHAHRATTIFPQIPIGATVHVVEASALREAERRRDEAIRKYASIELANPELTRNDHAIFGDLMLENKKQSEIITELAAALEFSLEGLAMWRKFQSPGNIAEVEDRAKQALAKHRGEK